MSIIKTAGQKVLDVAQYLKEASADKTIKYGAEKGAKHHIYVIPEFMQVVGENGAPVLDENGNVMQQKTLRAISQKIHDWNDTQGNYNSTVCLDGLIQYDENGVMINDGECPICKRVGEAWEIYNIRKEAAEAECTLPAGKAREDYLKKIYEGFRNELKAKEARSYVYVLIAVFQTDKDMAPVIDADTKLPTYALKVIKLSVNRLGDMQKQLKNSGAEFVGSELIIEYSNSENIMNQVGESTTSLVMDKDMFIMNYPGLFDNIYRDANEFDFETIDSAFKEWKGMSTAVAQAKMDKQFKNWDAYKAALDSNPQALYLEYSQTTANPNLGNIGAPNMGMMQGQMNQGQMQMQGQMPMQGQMNQGQMQGQMNQGQMQGQLPMQGQMNQGQPMQGQPMQGQPQQMQGQPMQGQPQPMQGQPMQGQPMQGQPMQGQPMQGQPMQGQPQQQMNIPDPNTAFGGVGIRI